MSSAQRPSPAMPLPHHPGHPGPSGHPIPNGHPNMQQPGPPKPANTPAQQLAALNELTWLQIGNLAESLGELEQAKSAFERALHHNPYSVQAMNSISCILRTKEQFPQAAEYLQSILGLDANNGEVWGALGHCYLMMDDLQKAYSAYQQALYHLRDPKEPKLWYGIGILYDRYGSLDHAEEAFSQVMRMDPEFDKANEIYFRLGIIYKQQSKYDRSLECFRYIVNDPPRPLTEEDIWFQIGHVYEQQKDFSAARDAYKRVLERDPNHAKVLQQLGWLHHNATGGSQFTNQELAIDYLEKSVNSDNTDAQSWYLLGRCYMAQQKYPKAYEAYQQAVYRDGRNPTFWCSIGVLYYQINQYRDALDAYSRAIRLNPYISEVWYDLGTLYESCNNQINDALDAYQRAAELDPTNTHIKARLELLSQPGNRRPQMVPHPQDVHPQAYQQNVNGPPGPQWGSHGPPQTLPHSGPGGPPPPPPQHGLPTQRPAPSPYGDSQGPAPPPPAPPRHLNHSPDHHRQVDGQRLTPIRRVMSPPLAIRPIMSPTPRNGYAPPPPLSSHPQPPPPPPGNRILNPQHHNSPPAPHLGHPAGPGPMPAIMSASSYRPSPPPAEQKPDLTSPGSKHHPHYPPHLQEPMRGPPLPPAPERDDRERDGYNGQKRNREWEEENSNAKRIQNEETRSRLEDVAHHRPSPPSIRMASPRQHSRRSSSERGRQEDYRRETAPISSSTPLPPMGSQLPPMRDGPERREDDRPPLPPPPPQTKEEPKGAIEPPSRKVEVDENYDDEVEETKPNIVDKKSSSPREREPATNGMSVSAPTAVAT